MIPAQSSPRAGLARFLTRVRQPGQKITRPAETLDRVARSPSLDLIQPTPGSVTDGPRTGTSARFDIEPIIAHHGDLLGPQFPTFADPPNSGGVGLCGGIFSRDD